MDAVARHVRALDSSVKRRAVAWVWLGVYALLAAGLMSLLLVLARTPLLQHVLSGTDFFHVALVVHVDLSVLVWFMACGGLAWTLFGARDTSRWHDAAIVFAVLGTTMISTAPFVGADLPLMNNYVPVLQHPWFYAGLSALAVGLVIQVAGYLLTTAWWRELAGDVGMVRFALAMAAMTGAVAVASVAYAYGAMPPEADGQHYFEVLFWGGGHVLQFTNTLLVLLAWWLLARAAATMPMSARVGSLCFALAALPVLLVPWIFGQGVGSEGERSGFTELMRWGGLASMPLGLAVVAGLLSRSRLARDASHLRAALVCSITLFAAGGFIGFLIKGSNTMIPAHYHGSIVGVTLAFMGVVYWVLPMLGFALPRGRLLAVQPYLYGGGQLLHISGLAMSGGYGVQRKVAGAGQVLDGVAQTVGMGMMGLGGLLAALGGIAFLIIAIGALRSWGARVAPRQRFETVAAEVA